MLTHKTVLDACSRDESLALFCEWHHKFLLQVICASQWVECPSSKPSCGAACQEAQAEQPNDINCLCKGA